MSTHVNSCMNTWPDLVLYYSHMPISQEKWTFCEKRAYVNKRRPHQPAQACKIGSGPTIIKLIPCSTQLSTKFILLINVKILTFFSMINKTSESLKARIVNLFQHCCCYEQLKFPDQLSYAWNCFYNLKSRCSSDSTYQGDYRRHLQIKQLK